MDTSPRPHGAPAAEKLVKVPYKHGRGADNACACAFYVVGVGRSCPHLRAPTRARRRGRRTFSPHEAKFSGWPGSI